ncbi:hypothetical protein PCASD_01319 [Puccinia coronata f. sp. avenae]|nr:hypothetical protein PCASD_25430 [Puccinia coronata f. sp. avenae]PLW49975.1 hypothetical protein PCASD_01319 [Puccinia coronata f. sp. avenae]
MTPELRHLSDKVLYIGDIISALNLDPKRFLTAFLKDKTKEITCRPKHARKIPGRAGLGQTPPNQDPTQTSLANGLPAGLEHTVPMGCPWAAHGPGHCGAGLARITQ